MAPRKKTRPAAKKTPVKHFTFQLNLSGLAGIALAAFCLFLWMFLLGIWAGRTIISPCPSAPAVEKFATAAHPATGISNIDTNETKSTAIFVQPRERKKRIISDEPPLYPEP